MQQQIVDAKNTIKVNNWLSEHAIDLAQSQLFVGRGLDVKIRWSPESSLVSLYREMLSSEALDGRDETQLGGGPHSIPPGRG